MLLWWSCQSPGAHCCSLLNHLNSFHGGMFKCNAKSDADLLFYSVILNVIAAQYTCSLKGVYCSHWLVQSCCHCSCMHFPVYSHWLPGYINVQTILVIVTMAGLFSGQNSCMCTCVCIIQDLFQMWPKKTHSYPLWRALRFRKKWRKTSFEELEQN